MNRFKVRLLVVLSIFSLAFAGSAMADENALIAQKTDANSQEVSSLKNQVNDLNKKLSMLESRLTNVQGQMAAEKPAIAHTGHDIPAAGPLSGIEVHGFIDTQYNNNFRQPKIPSATTNTNTGRVFDTKAGSFAVNAAEIDIAKVAKNPGDAGFRTDIMYGEDANVVNGSANPSDQLSKVDLQQAYVEYIAPLHFWEGNKVLPSSVNIKAGRFVTLAGLEVIEAPQNWNISRSFMFGYGLPFTHTGVRTEFGLFNNFLDVYLGLNNGWDVAVDNNKFKTLESAVGWKLWGIQFFHTLYWGAESTTSSGQKRILITNTATYDITEKLSVMGEANWGKQNGITSATPIPQDQDEANWWGFAGYVRYKFTPKFAVSSRSELFADNQAYRTNLSTPALNNDRVFEQTFTAEYKLTDQLISRGELRFDKGNENNTFAQGINGTGGQTSGAHSSQTTIGAQLIYVV